MRIRVKIDGTVNASSTEEAMKMVGEYFTNMVDGEDWPDSPFVFPTDIHFLPEEPTETTLGYVEKQE